MVHAVQAQDVTVTGEVVRGQLDRVVVIPVSATLRAGQQATFQARAYDMDGNEIFGLTFFWSVVAGGGTIDQNGTFLATEVGVFPNTIKAEATDGPITRAGFASVTVEANNTVQEIAQLIRNIIQQNPVARTIAENLTTVFTPALVTITTITTIAQVLTAVPAISSLSNLLLYTSYLWSALLEFLGLKRRRRPWGIVYNAETKEPLSLVVVQLIDLESGQPIEQRVTDAYGRFGFLVKPGRYKINPIHPQFSFPSQISPHKGDLRYSDLYHGEEIVINDPNTVIVANIPLDPLAFEAVGSRSGLRYLSFRRLSVFLLAASVLLQGFMIFIYPSTRNYVLFGVYLSILIAMAILLRRRQRAWGVVYDAQTKEELANAQIFITQEEDSRFVSRKVTDEFGRFYLLLPTGTYRLAVQHPEYQFPGPAESFGYKGEPIQVGPKTPLVHVDIPMVKIEAAPQPVNSEQEAENA